MPPAESRLAELHRLGQSPWFDYISRELVARGGLRRMVDRDGLGGVTSNPAIFEKAIGARDGLRRADPRARARGPGRGGDLRPPGGRRRARRLRRARARVPGQRRRGRLRLHRGLARLRLRHGEDHRRGPAPLRRRGPAQRDDQDPRHPRGRAGDPRDAAAGPQHQRHAAVLDESVRGRRRRLSRGARVPAAARSHDPRHVVGGELLRVARRHAGRQAAGRDGSRPPPTRRSGGGSRRSRARPRWPTPRSSTSAFAATSTAATGSSSPPRAPRCSASCGRAPAPRTPPTPTCCTWTSSSASTP